MSCTKCNPCSQTQPICVEDTSCECPVFITTDCSTLSEDLACSGILKGQTETEVLKQLDAYICERFDSVENFFQLVNIGTGAEVYKGISILGKKELRSLTSDGTVVITQNADSIDFSVDVSAPPLELLNEGSGEGIIIRGRNAANYGSVGLNAIDLSYSDSASTSKGATGTYSFSGGYNNISSEQGTVTFGSNNIANQANAIAIGDNNKATNPSAVALGNYNTASGAYSVAIGNGMFSRSFSEASFGSYGTDYTPLNIYSKNSLDRILNVGNGSTAFFPSDAFTILKNGLATLPSVTNALITADVTGKAVVTKEYLSSAIGDATQGIEDVITTNPLITNDSTVQLEYGSSFKITRETGDSITHPHFEMDSKVDFASGDYPLVRLGIAESDGDFIRGFSMNYPSIGEFFVHDDTYGIRYYNIPTNLQYNSLVHKDYVDQNVQRIITTSGNIFASDNNSTIIINNGSSNITITIDAGTVGDTVCVGFIQQGTGTVTFVASGVTINTPTGLKIKGQNYNAYIEQIGVSNVFHLLGNVIA